MIQVDKLQKSFGQTQALKGISFNIQEGEFYGLLGPNGAGKTTTISILSTILRPDGGQAIVNGHDLAIASREVKRSIGVVPQEIALYNDLSAYENLKFWGGLYGLPDKALNKKIASVLELVGLTDRQKDKVKTYSGGMKRRINIAAALLHSPKVLFMDEPTVGIDPQSRNLIFDLMETLHEEGMTLVYTTHYMEEAERLCDRIGIIDHGEIIAEGSLLELKQNMDSNDTLIVHTEEMTPEQQKQMMGKVSQATFSDGKSLEMPSKKPHEDLVRVIGSLGEAGVGIRQVEIKGISLENIFLNLTGRKLRD